MQKNFARNHEKKIILRNIRRFVDDSFVPSSKQPSVLYCKLTYFKSTPSKLWLTLLEVTFVHRNRETTAWVSSTVDFCLNSQIESEKPLLYWFKNSKYAVAIPPSPCILFRYHYLISFLCTFMHSARRGV